MKRLLYVLTSLCLLVGLFAGCEKNPLEETGGTNGGSVSGGDGITTIEGVVTSKTTGKPLLLASVTLLPADKMTLTDTAGAFRFRDIAAGTYKLQVKRTGYAPYTTGEIKVAAGKTVQYNIALEAEQSDLQIQDINGEVIDELAIEDDATQGVFVLKNTGAKIIEWEIPKLAVDWISDFSMQSGKLAPGASDRVEFSIDRSKLSAGINEAFLYIGSGVGDKMLKITVHIEMSYQLLNEQDEEISELDLDNKIQGAFKIKNTGNGILKWKIPTSSSNEEWLWIFSYTEGSLAPDDAVTIVLVVDRSKASEGVNEEILSISSTGGDKQLTVRCFIERGSDYMETVCGTNIAMVAVSGGLFTMGATSEQGSDARDNEKPVHLVSLEDFYIGRFEVTQAQWKEVMGTNNPLWYEMPLPVDNVSWYEAVQFCEKLSEMTGKTYRLPTEAEWEYAARGGQHADGTKYAGSNTISDVAWYNGNTGSVAARGCKRPNGLGIYDMSGNAAEWCSDWYGEDYYSSSPVVNPHGPSSGSSRVTRGGACYSSAVGCRVSNRGYGTSDSRIGFRVACSSK